MIEQHMTNVYEIEQIYLILCLVDKRLSKMKPIQIKVVKIYFFTSTSLAQSKTRFKKILYYIYTSLKLLFSNLYL
jgi:surface polysaccharide O-acyltransferase-like enzyme